MKRTVIATFISVVALSSTLTFAADNMERVEKNMTRSEVNALLGQPSAVKNAGSSEVWQYTHSGQVSFVNGKVASVLVLGITE